MRGRRHTLGAVFVLNHRDALALPAPPVGPIAREARRQGGFLELDKHNWPWSMMLVPEMNVDLFELANNHMWRTGFLFRDWYPEYAEKYMQVEMIDGQFTERGWIEFGFENYYALLNCGFKMQPTAGSASGVHPVPLGYGRVYVHVGGEFTYQKWVDGLLNGRSFVTTGPMLLASAKKIDDSRVIVEGSLDSATEPLSLELLVNGKVIKTVDLHNASQEHDSYHVPFQVELTLNGSSWVAARAFARHGTDRVCFAHTAPTFFEQSSRPAPAHPSSTRLLSKTRA